MNIFLIALFIGTASAVNSAQPLTITPDLIRFSVVVQATNDGIRCSGTLISPRHVLTAGHCFESTMRTSPMKVLLLKSENEIRTTAKIRTVDVHPFWSFAVSTMKTRNEAVRTLPEELKKIELQMVALNDVECPFDGNVDWEGADLEAFLKLAQKWWAPRREAPLTPFRKLHLEMITLLERHRLHLDMQKADATQVPESDLAIVELMEDVDPTYYTPAALDFTFTGKGKVGHDVLVAGFGHRFTNMPAEFPFNKPSFGKAQIGSRIGTDVLEVAGSSVICPGDSGGPTFYRKKGKVHLVGVNVKTRGCDHRDSISYTTLVHFHEKWIRGILANYRTPISRLFFDPTLIEAQRDRNYP